MEPVLGSWRNLDLDPDACMHAGFRFETYYRYVIHTHSDPDTCIRNSYLKPYIDVEKLIQVHTHIL